MVLESFEWEVEKDNDIDYTFEYARRAFGDESGS